MNKSVNKYWHYYEVDLSQWVFIYNIKVNRSVNDTSCLPLHGILYRRKRCKQRDLNEIDLIWRNSAMKLSFDSSAVIEYPGLLSIHIYFVNLSLQFS